MPLSRIYIGAVYLLCSSVEYIVEQYTHIYSSVEYIVEQYTYYGAYRVYSGAVYILNGIVLM